MATIELVKQPNSTLGIPWVHSYIKFTYDNGEVGTFSGWPQFTAEQDLDWKQTMSAVLENIFSGTPSEYGKVEVSYKPYVNDIDINPDYDNDGIPDIRTLLFTGTDAELDTKKSLMMAEATTLDAGNYIYNFLSQNCNTTAAHLLNAAGFSMPSGDGLWTPGQQQEFSHDITGGIATFLIDFLEGAWQFAASVGKDFLGFFESYAADIKGWIDWVAGEHNADVTEVAQAAGPMLDIMLMLEKGEAVASTAGTTGADTLLLNAARNWALGGEGDDVLKSANGRDTLMGNEGVDTAHYENVTGGQGIVVDMATGRTSLAGSLKDEFHDIENVTGSDFADTITGDVGDNILSGGKGNDVLTGGAGINTFVYGADFGNDIVQQAYHQLGNKIQLDGLNDSDVTLNRVGSDLVITASSTGQTMTINNQYLHTAWYEYEVGSLIFADETEWDLTAGVLYEGDATAATTVLAGFGNDTLAGGAGNDILIGDAGSDVFLYGINSGNDRVQETYYHTGNTVQLDGLNDADVTLNRTGSDLVITNSASGNTLTVVKQFVNTNYGYEASSLVFADGSSWDLTAGVLYEGDATAATYVLGGFGNDTLVGGAGNDTLKGDAGLDTFRWGAGGGNDVINESYLHTGNSIHLDGLTGDDITLTISSGTLVVTDNISGNTLAVTNQYWNTNYGYEVSTITFADGKAWNITANGLATGTAGNDALTASYVGDNVVLGYGGNDQLAGHNFADMIVGGQGDDTLTGATGADTLEGGSGADVFVFDAITDSTTTSGDSITDFEQGLDLIDVTTLGFDNVSAGAHSGNTLGFINDGTVTTISGNSGFEITLTGVYNLTAGNFLLAA